MFGRHFLSLADFGRDDVLALIETALVLKRLQADKTPHEVLSQNALAMIFQKPSNRTRVSFEIGIWQLGGKAIVIRPDEIGLGEREAIPDVARVLARYVDAVMMRVLRHTDITEYAANSSVPVINGLSDLFHPCQAIADLLTIKEQKPELEGLKLCYIGDGNNVCNSLIIMCNLVGIGIRVACPKGFEPTISPDEWSYEVVNNPREAVVDCDVVYTDVWTSMGQEQETLHRLRAFEGYGVTEALLERSKADSIFLHCLPAHRGEEVDNFVVDGTRSRVFDQAENRLHAQKALLCHLLLKDFSAASLT